MPLSSGSKMSQNVQRQKPSSKPKLRQKVIDIYNATSTGHQVGGGVSKPISWHKSRTTKLQQQFKDHPLLVSASATTALVSKTETSTVPATGKNTTSNAGNNGAVSVPADIVKIKEKQHNGHKMAAAAKPVTAQDGTSDPPHGPGPVPTTIINKATAYAAAEDGPALHPCITTSLPVTLSTSHPSTKIFTNCTVYVNGTTAPAISDLVLKRYLCTHGASIATMLARRSVTHVILGKPNSPGGGGGAGGGLAAGKLQKELTTSGKQIKFVSVEWALDSIKAGKRLPEHKYTVLSMQGVKQKGIVGFVKGTGE